jgi:hypothetical protein
MVALFILFSLPIDQDEKRKVLSVVACWRIGIVVKSVCGGTTVSAAHNHGNESVAQA